MSECTRAWTGGTFSIVTRTWQTALSVESDPWQQPPNARASSPTQQGIKL